MTLPKIWRPKEEQEEVFVRVDRAADNTHIEAVIDGAPLDRGRSGWTTLK